MPRLFGGCGSVCATEGICSEEAREEALVAKRLKAQGSELRKHWGNTLYMKDECGCRMPDVPLLFTSFKNKAESRGRIREPFDAPRRLPPLPEVQEVELKAALATALTFLPTLEELGYPTEEAEAALKDDPRGVMRFVGGEDAALERLQKWMFDDDRLKDYFDIRNGMLGEGYSSKLSPWLSLGCISPRRIWKEAQRYEQERTKNKSTYWLIFELTWRDFFAYMALSQGNKIFLLGGITGERTPWQGSHEDLERWKAGKTGDALVDANMLELKATGFMSNRGRQNVASYLIFDLGVDWRYGAAHFEELLLDHDPCSNWGNWVAAAGLTGQRVNKFSTRKQLNDYDPKRAYVNHWLKGGAGSEPTPTAAPRGADAEEEEGGAGARRERRWGGGGGGSKGGGKGGGRGGGSNSGGYGGSGGYGAGSYSAYAPGGGRGGAGGGGRGAKRTWQARAPEEAWGA